MGAKKKIQVVHTDLGFTSANVSEAKESAKVDEIEYEEFQEYNNSYEDYSSEDQNYLKCGLNIALEIKTEVKEEEIQEVEEVIKFVNKRKYARYILLLIGMALIFSLILLIEILS